MQKRWQFYDPKVVSFKELVSVFLLAGSTTPISRGPDRGSSYRSIAFINAAEKNY
jgi:peptide-methionine (S)-S-oxide reductase